MACDHSKEHRSLVHVVAMNDTEGGPFTRWCAEIWIWCEECGARFRFVGVPLGLSAGQPTVSVDGYELRVPMVPVVPPRVHEEMH